MALTYYQKMKDPTGQAARYLDFVSNFSFDIKHRDGSRHINADSLSRLRPCEFDDGKPCLQCNKRVTGKHTLKAVQTRAKAARSGADTANDGLISAADVQSPGGPHQTSDDRLTSDSSYRSRKRRRRSRAAAALDNTAPQAWDTIAVWTPAELREKQLGDCDVGPALMWAESAGHPDWSTVEGASPMLRSLWQQLFDSLIVKDGVLYHISYNSSGLITHLQLILPAELKVAFLILNLPNVFRT